MVLPMTLETDLLLDRRRLKRRLFLWRGAAIAVAAVAIIATTFHVGPMSDTLKGPYVARLSVKGIITADRKVITRLEKLAKDPKVSALIVAIDSPGGTVGGGESLHDAIAQVAQTKPVVAVMGGMGASAGYMIAVPAARIFAQESTLTGSIGVLMETQEFSGLMNTLGIGSTTLVSGPLKDQPSLTHPTSPAGRQVLQGMVDDMYDMFVGMVAQGRHMDPAHVRELADGRAYTGRQAKKLGLIDDFGGEPQARAWLEKERHVPADLRVEDVREISLQDRLLGANSEADGLVTGLVRAAVTGLRQGMAQGGFDGAMAVWQPSRDVR